MPDNPPNASWRAPIGAVRGGLPLVAAATMAVLAAAIPASAARAQYQDTTSQMSGKLTNDRTQSNISDQGSGYLPNGPYGQYFSARGNRLPKANPRQPAQTGGLPDSGRGASGEPYLAEWYRRRATGRTPEELGISWVDGQDRLIVAALTADGEMARAGLLGGDRIVSVGATAVASPAQWQRAIDAVPAGQDVIITLERDGKPASLHWAPPARKAEEIPTGPKAALPAEQPEGRSIHFITAARLRRWPTATAIWAFRWIMNIRSGQFSRPSSRAVPPPRPDCCRAIRSNR